MDKFVVTRFAPSPTGPLHLGHALSAVTAARLAAEAGGRFLVRIEDLDAGRSRPEFVDAIFADLNWLGLAWERPVWFQSERLGAYGAALARLRADKLVYPCFCTRADIAREVAASLSAPHGPDGPLYPGTCRALPDAERHAHLAAGDAHSWRLDMAAAIARAGPLTWRDARTGRVDARPDLFGDVVLARKDAPASYHLAVTVDDAAQGVTLVVRGEDLFHATHVHRLLQSLLGLAVPDYHHHALIGDADGRRLAKRDRAASLADLRAAGMDGTALADGLRQGQLPLGFRLVAP
ncbi:tRNA glutamyl-Q(34) synthetase GluQRS [Sphingomonas sp. BGYR3]|uniref:tRNA glutamyl-Q(34) synthetase GluQRS n=1 Tax=Sphingomonas sp. BGYR3 TaxID=2975483 RepID=UPI0021A91FB3|nr:tRNA glutamyl-Q(34) synthetase GluQRS [Sphingomonas sp. BGYR3]